MEFYLNLIFEFIKFLDVVNYYFIEKNNIYKNIILMFFCYLIKVNFCNNLFIL